MVLGRTGIGAALLGALLSVVHLSPGYVNRRLLDGDWSWLPQLDTMSRTVLLYSYVTRGVAFVLGVGVVFALGYWAGTRSDLRENYQGLVLGLGLGGILGYVVALGAFVLVPANDPILADDGFLTGVLLLGRGIGAAVQFAVVGFAGAAFATLVGGSRGNVVSTSDEVHAGSPD